MGRIVAISGGDSQGYIDNIKAAFEPLEGNPLSEAIVGVKNFSDEEDADFIAYILPESVSTIMNELERFDIDGAIEGFQPKKFATTITDIITILPGYIRV